MTLKCIAVDDEPLALDIIEDYVSKVPFLELVKRTENAIEALQMVQAGGIDLVFLDIQMPDLTGIQFLKIANNKASYILTTAYSQYALESYDLNVSDYLLKPIAFDRFYKAVEKVHNQHKNNAEPAPATAPVVPVAAPAAVPVQPVQDFIFVKTEHKIQKIELDNILYIEGLKDYISIFTKAERVITLQNMKRMEETLPQSQFIRVHKSYIIALDKIESIERSRITICGKIIPIGDTYRDEFFKKIENKNI
ncbi:two component transcriptional regulator, LytTR family [Pedobacter westerhofensis]|jgi:DNA-binding LytR/AlgR family response regulator|uniref:Two component transcriptional regulator, LytTR family n=1 Tax=Pedobacter westerhofensis TaxID=425512 RepID=A0A521EJB1_9SPHI|nr:LytTR family DNA-binding domain-containing protein [Pedobacter westerhofensis]SMO83230.1 two component transcriptional regulator, LytTR family [Pedobacter westerhofensis]